MTLIIIKLIISAVLIGVSFKLYTDFIFSRGTIMKPSAALLLLALTATILAFIIYFLFTYQS